MGSFKILKIIYFSIITILIVFNIFLTPIRADNFYADISIDVDSSGFVTIDGITNHPDILVENSEIYTSKKQSYWLINITKEDIFSDYIFILTLPEKSSINYIKSPGYISIEEDSGNLIVKGFGENESLSILLQYQTEKLSETQSFDFLSIILLTFLIFLIIILILFISREKLKVNNPDSNVQEFKGLNSRQKEIMSLLIDKNIPLTQTDIQKELNIPKAAVSRNVRGLELKGLIEKEQIGMSNLIRIKKQ